MSQVEYVCTDKSFDINDYEYLISFSIFPEIFDEIVEELRKFNINYRLVDKFYNEFSYSSSLILFVSKLDYHLPLIKELREKYDL